MMQAPTSCTGTGVGTCYRLQLGVNTITGVFRMRVKLFLALLAFSFAAYASQSGTSQDVGVILSEQKQLQQDVAAGKGGLARLTPKEKEALATAQARVFVLLEGKSTIDELPMDQRVEAFNALESIKAIVSAKPKDQTICRRERVLGSHRAVTSCRTAEEREQEVEAAANALTPRGQMLRREGL